MGNIASLVISSDDFFHIAFGTFGDLAQSSLALRTLGYLGFNAGATAIRVICCRLGSSPQDVLTLRAVSGVPVGI